VEERARSCRRRHRLAIPQLDSTQHSVSAVVPVTGSLTHPHTSSGDTRSAMMKGSVAIHLLCAVLGGVAIIQSAPAAKKRLLPISRFAFPPPQLVIDFVLSYLRV